MPTDASHDRVIVIGGGLAGIAAAIRLAECGVRVTLVETRKRLGGRATSFIDPATGQTLDNCQHVLLRGCTNLIDLYQRLGVDDRIQWHRTLYFADGRGHLDELAADDLPAPLHLLRCLLSFTTLTGREKLAILRGMLGVLQVSPLARRRSPHLAEETFLDWLRHHRQPQAVIDTFWSLIVTSACNERPDRVTASYAIQVLQEGMLYDNDAYEMGVPATPLVELYDAAHHRIEKAGGEIILGSGAEALLYNPSPRRITYLRLSDRQELTGSDFISAVPPDRLARLVSEQMICDDDRLGALDALATSPIIGIHLFFRRGGGRPVMDLPHMALMNGQLQWVFDKGMTSPDALGADAPSTTESAPAADTRPVHHLHGVISAAHEMVHESAEHIVSQALADLRRVLPALAEAELVHSRVIKEKRATFAARPGIDALRPPVSPDGGGGVRNLHLAGDWVRTGWPATMESAVRSGYSAAAAVLRRRGQRIAACPAPDLAPSTLYRLLSA